MSAPSKDRASTEHSAPHARSGDARGDARSGDARKCALRRCARAQVRRCAGAHTHTELVLARAPELVELVISWCSSGARGARCSASSSRGRAGTQAAQQGLTGAAALGRPWPQPRVCLVFVLGKICSDLVNDLMFGKNGMRLAKMDSTNVRNVTRQKISRDFVFWNEVS